MTCRHHKLPFGAETTADGVRFRLWAPRAGTVSLLLDQAIPGGEPLPMTAEGNGWFSLTTDRAKAGSRYRYSVDGRALPDPATRYQPESVHGASEVVNPEAYEWQDADWRGRPWEEIVLYELHVGTFSNSGDFAGVIAHLDHIRDLGATAVELMPVADFPGDRNWGYDGVLLYAPARCYGRPEDLKRLVEACHQRGLAVILDVVYNHFGPEGNYLSVIAPDYFTDRYHTPWGAAVDYDGPNSRPARDFAIHNALYWLEEFHFDGLRLDAVHAIFDESAPDILTELAATVRRQVADRPVHLILENDRNEARRLNHGKKRLTSYTAQWNDDLHHALHVILTGEHGGYYADFADRPVEHLARALAAGFAYQGEPSAYRGGNPRGEHSAELPATAFVAFLQNHDQVGNNAFGTRIGARVGEELLHAAVTIILLSPQIPLLFMGEEWNSQRPFTFFCDFEPGLAGAVREGRRREFAKFPEFLDDSAREKIPDPTARATFDMSRLDWSEPVHPEKLFWLDRYRALLALRAREIVPRLVGMLPFAGSYRLPAPEALRVDWRLGDGSCLVLLANFGAAPALLDPPPGEARQLYCSVDGPSPSACIAPHSAAFYLASSRGAA